jgi:hypothetical protein
LGESVAKKGRENTVFTASDAATDARTLLRTRLSRAEDDQGAKGSTDVGTVPGAASEAETSSRLSNRRSARRRQTLACV